MRSGAVYLRLCCGLEQCTGGMLGVAVKLCHIKLCMAVPRSFARLVENGTLGVRDASTGQRLIKRSLRKIAGGATTLQDSYECSALKAGCRKEIPIGPERAFLGFSKENDQT